MPLIPEQQARAVHADALDDLAYVVHHAAVVDGLGEHNVTEMAAAGLGVGATREAHLVAMNSAHARVVHAAQGGKSRDLIVDALIVDFADGLAQYLVLAEHAELQLDRLLLYLHRHPALLV